MPTYVLTARAGALDDAARAAIATAITQAHHAATGAPGFFVQVVFADAPPGRRFLGGRPADDHVWIRGDIRDGRSAEARRGLMRAIVTDVAAIMGVATRDVWIYLAALAPADKIEYGEVLPEPGGEQAWFDALPAALRDELGGDGPEPFTL